MILKKDPPELSIFIATSQPRTDFTFDYIKKTITFTNPISLSDIQHIICGSVGIYMESYPDATQTGNTIYLRYDGQLNQSDKIRVSVRKKFTSHDKIPTPLSDPLPYDWVRPVVLIHRASLLAPTTYYPPTGQSAGAGAFNVCQAMDIKSNTIDGVWWCYLSELNPLFDIVPITSSQTEDDLKMEILKLRDKLSKFSGSMVSASVILTETIASM